MGIVRWLARLEAALQLRLMVGFTVVGFGMGIGFKMVMLQMRKLRLSSRPWETVGFGIMGAYGLNKLDDLEQWSKAKYQAEFTRKLDRNRDAMDDTYQGVLGENYSKWFGPKVV